MPVRPGVLDGVAQEVEQHPLHKAHIGLDGKGREAFVGKALGGAAEPAHPFLHGGGEVKAGGVKRTVPALYPSEIQNVIHQLLKNGHIAACHQERLLLVR